MVQELHESSVEWFIEKIGLPNEVLDIRKDIIDLHASLIDCEVLFGKKKGSNGFKLDGCKDVNVVARIQKFYTTIYQKLRSPTTQLGLILLKQ
jgi:hypothetical protein